ncbi:MAG: PTS transporter subunit EIIC [Gemella sp.]|nr:PTS transporter subunit EIIC [Gemella sp.]
MSKQYKELAKDILAHVGGKENISSSRQCMTRIRFILKDNSKADTEYLNSLKDVVQVVQAGSEYQVVLGDKVTDVYTELLKEDINAEKVTTEKSEETNKQNLFYKSIDVISSILQPVLAPMAAVGIIKGLGTLLQATMGLNEKNSILAVILKAAGDGLFQFLPILLAVTSARKFKMNEFTAAAIGAALVYPTLPASIAALKKAGIETVLGLPFQLPHAANGYLSTMIPIVLAIFVASKVEAFMKRVTPSVARMFLVPFTTILIIVPLTFLVVGPVANTISGILGAGFKSVLGFSPILYGFLLAGVWQILVMFGLHWAVAALAILQFSQNGWTDILVPIGLVTFANAGVLGAVLLKAKSRKLKNIAAPSFISAFFGITEPGIYGVTLPLKVPFIISSVVAAFLGAGIQAFALKNHAMGALGIFAIPGYISPEAGLTPMYTLIAFDIAAVVIAFIIQMLVPLPKAAYEKDEE